MNLYQTIQYIKADLARHYLIESGTLRPTFKHKINIILYGFGLHAIIVYRIGCYLHGVHIHKYFKRFLLEIQGCMSTFVKRYYGINIDKEASIGEGLYIGHFGGIYVGRCSIGKTCSIHQQTRIEDEVQIGNNVWIGGHSCIKKNIIIDDDATISSGSVVIRNINRCSLVKGNPARVVMARFDNTSLLVKSDNNIS